jgi:hypothetical protein
VWPVLVFAVMAVARWGASFSPPHIFIINSVLVVLFCFVLLFFHFFVFPGDTTGTLYLQVTIKLITEDGLMRETFPMDCDVWTSA